MKKLRIAQISPLRFPVPTSKRGGNERVISYLTEELVRRGHDVTLFASGDSKTKANLVSVRKIALNTTKFDENNNLWNIFNHSFSFEHANEFDIIHCHWDIMGAMLQRFVKTPVLNTSHCVFSPEKCVHDIYKHYKDDLNIAFISEKQKKNIPINFKNSWVIRNGIDFAPFKFSKNPKNHLVWVGRVTPGKYLKEAILVAKQAKEKLFFAGQIEDFSKDYFEKEIKPLLDNNIKYVGELNIGQLSKFYGSAKACIFPLGLAKIESLACGTPIINFSKNAVDDIKNISQIDRAECRKFAEENYSIKKMVDEYEKVYYQIIGDKK